ncbi:hypothetical protein M9Y10_044958 [Tritrichomonas musculus]|uniref:RING-type domain-containing protein n=1 Tax=Tritrichomonas musculus TaxID=1915356 RepID=A0ABR2JU79_9EUKA
MKQSSISYCKFDDRTSCIIASLPHRTDTQVIYIDQIMGTLLFSGIKGYDVFDDRKSAFDFVSKDRKLLQCVDARSILGYVFSEKCCHLILIEKEKPLFPIFDNHMIFSIENVVFIDIPTETRCPQALSVNIEILKKYPFNHAHYFCPTLDLSKDFGSRTNVIRTCWNQKLAIPFQRFSDLIPNLCVSIYQGVVSYTPFVEINIAILFMSSRLFPPLLAKSGKYHFSEAGITCNEYIIDVYLIKTIENDFEVLNHAIQIGDFPFNWSSDQNSSKIAFENMEDIKKNTKIFIQRTKDYFKYDYITFVNFMNKGGIEKSLTEALDIALNELSDSANTLNSLSIEQDVFEWIQSIKNSSSLEEYVQNYWPRASKKIKKFGFTRSLISNIANNQLSINGQVDENTPYQFNPQSYQKGICRFLYTQSFDRELIGLFFYIMKLLEIMCLDEFGLNFPEKLVMPYQIDTFLNGFVYFSAKFLLEFNLYISNFGDMQIGDLTNLIFEYMKPPNVDIDTYVINYQSLFDASLILKNISIPSLFSVSQGPSSFIMNPSIGNHILHPFNDGLIEFSKKDQPLIICLSEPSYIKYILLKSTNAIGVSIFGGFRLNRMIEIASNVLLPWVPKSNQKNSGSYIRIDLESHSMIYDYNINPHEFEKVRFLILKFKTFRKDQLKVGNIYVFGSHDGPSSPNNKLSILPKPTRCSSLKLTSSDPSFNQSPIRFSSEQNLELKIVHTDTALPQKTKDLPVPQNSQSPPNPPNIQIPQESQTSPSSPNFPKPQTFQRSQSIDGHKSKKNPYQDQKDISDSYLTGNSLQRSQSSLIEVDTKSSPNQKSSKSHSNSKNSKSKVYSPTKNSHQQQPSVNNSKSRVDAIIESERNRIRNRENYLEYQKKLIANNEILDNFDFEKIFNPNKIDKEPRRAACSKCQSKDLCNDCVNCKRPFCKKCLKTLQIQFKELTFCEECINKRHQCLLEIEKLKQLQLEAIKEKYPFISLHNDQISLSQKVPLMKLNFLLPSAVSEISDFSGFGDINRPLLSTFAYEPPIPQKIMNRLPECLFTSNVNWVFETNFAPLTVIFTTECKITAIHITCFTKLEVSIEGAKPSHFTFEPPGSIQKVEFVGRMANVVLKGSKIELRNIRFFGVPVFQKVDPKTDNKLTLLPSKPRSLIKISPMTCQFSKDLNMHEFAFNSTYEFVGVKYSALSLLPSETIIELRTDKSVEYLHNVVARIPANANGPPSMGIILFTKYYQASKVRIFYPRLQQQLSFHYVMEMPEMLILRKESQNINNK